MIYGKCDTDCARIPSKYCQHSHKKTCGNRPAKCTSATPCRVHAHLVYRLKPTVSQFLTCRYTTKLSNHGKRTWKLDYSNKKIKKGETTGSSLPLLFLQFSKYFHHIFILHIQNFSNFLNILIGSGNIWVTSTPLWYNALLWISTEPLNMFQTVLR